MQGLKKIWTSLLLLLAVAAFTCPAIHCEEPIPPSVKIRQINDGLVVVVNHNQVSLDESNFGCSQESNEISVDLQLKNERTIIESLQGNPNIARNGVSVEALPQKNMKRIKIIPKLRLYCDEAKLVSKFQKYVTYFYPAGRALQLISAEAKGFELDERNPKSQIKGHIVLKFNEALGAIDLADAVKVSDNNLTLKLNPRDFLQQELLTALFPMGNLKVNTVSSSDTGEHTFGFRTINEADINKITAKLLKSPESSELRLEITLTHSLYSAGIKFYEKGESGKALTYLDAAKSDPSSALVSRMSMGTIFWNDDNFTEAARNFSELIELDRSWEFPEARYFAAKSSYLANKRLSFELTNRLKEFLRRCERTPYSSCDDARELSELVNEPLLKLNIASKAELKKLVAKLADPKLNYNEVQKNIFHYWATWCPVCLQEMPKIMQYAVEHPNISLYIIAKNDTQKNILNSLIKAGAIRRKNIFYYIDTKDDIMLRQMVPLILASREPVTPLPISVFLQRDLPFYITDKLHWTDSELSEIWKIRYRQ